MLIFVLVSFSRQIIGRKYTIYTIIPSLPDMRGIVTNLVTSGDSVSVTRLQAYKVDASFCDYMPN